MKQEFSSESKESAWNSAVESSRRLSYWIQMGNTYYDQKNYLKYKDCLMIFFKEISSKLSEEEMEETLNMVEDVVKGESGYNADMVKNSENQEIIFSSNFPSLLDNFDIHLRRLADKHNLLIPDKKSIWDSIQ